MREVKRLSKNITGSIFHGLKIMCAVILLMGMGLSMNADEKIRFYLKDPEKYFENKKNIALLQAAMSGDLAKAKALVATGANPNDEGPTRDLNANRLRLIHYAIASESKQAVKILMALGADPELNAKHNGPAFLFAVTLNDVDMLELLLDLRPIKSLSDETLSELLFESITQGRRRCLFLLLDRGAPIDFRSAAEDTILMGAMSTQDFDLAEHLIQRGASVIIDTPSGVTPAYQVQYMLTRYTPGSSTYLTLQRIKKLMLERGAVFPATDPKELRERRKKNSNTHQR
jgi:ankyrin repeat protein